MAAFIAAAIPSPSSLTKFRTRRRQQLILSAKLEFPSFLPREVEDIKDTFARKLATRIERVPVSFSDNCIMSSCVKPLLVQSETAPVVLLHGFDSSCLEWRYTYPLLEEAGLETWAIDILGWGFSDLESRPSCDVASKRKHLYQLWKSYIRRPMILVGPSLGAAVAIDFAVNHPEAVENLVLIDASVYAEGTGNLAKLPRAIAYAGVSLLKNIALRLYVNYIAFSGLPFTTSYDWMSIGRLHCLYPWWEDASVNFMISGGYNIISQIEKVKQNTLIIWGEDDKIISSKLAVIFLLVSESRCIDDQSRCSSKEAVHDLMVMGIFYSVVHNDCASVFRRWLDSQKRGRYKKMILRHGFRYIKVKSRE